MALSGDEGRSCVSVCPGPEQARTIAFAMPILKRAAHVVVLTVEGGAAVPAPTGQQLCHYLQLSGVPAKPLTVGLNGRLTGEAVLEHANALNCDLLIKGALSLASFSLRGF